MQKIVVVVLLIILAAVGYGWWETDQPATAAAIPPKVVHRSEALEGIDANTFALTQRLASMASTPAEQSLAEDAQRVADHELDVAFAAALRQIEAHPPQLSAAAAKIQERLDKSQKQLDADQASVNRLVSAVGQASDSQRPALQEQLDLVATQLELDKDEVEEANQDLLEAGGNQHKRIEQMMQQHASAARIHPAAAATGARSNTGPKGLVLAFEQWQALRRKEAWLAYASNEATNSAVRVSAQRQRLAADLEAAKASIPQLVSHTRNARSSSTAAMTSAVARTDLQSNTTNVASGARSHGGQIGPASSSSPRESPQADTASANGSVASPARPNGPQSSSTDPVASSAPTASDLLATTRRISADQKILTLLDQRGAALRQLAGTYVQWNSLARAQSMAVLHEILQGTALVVAIILVLLFLDRSLERLLGRTKLDRRQIGTLRSVTRVSLQVLAVLLMVLIIIGVPGQLGTMIGLAGAGLTVALKDFIVAFIGWLVLMGRNGVRLGDWVEINGVSGEVVELGMFHTVLLETGNWTDAGQPTGRRVTFTNSYAIEKHYFNFSTAGQWLWDELVVLVPFDKDPNRIAEAINKEVMAATADSAHQAEEEWRRAGRRGTGFSATPGISVKPALGGIEVAVRYITRASERFALRSRLFQSAVRLLSLEYPTQSRPNQKGAT